MLHIVRHMFCESIAKQNLMVTLISIFSPRKGQSQVKPDQIRSNFQIRNFHTKTYLSCQVLSQDSRNVIHFDVRQLKMPEMRFKKVTSPLPTWFLAIAQPKIKILFWNFVCLLFVCILITYILCFGYYENFEFYRHSIWEIEIFNIGVKIEKIIFKIRDSCFVECSILRHLAFFDCVLLQS